MQKTSAIRWAALAAILALVFFIGRTTAPEKTPSAPVDQGGSASQNKKVRPLRDFAPEHAPDIANSARKPLPAHDIPLKQVLADLEQRAEAGDSEAATRLARDLHRCDASRALEVVLPIAANYQLGQKIDGAKPDALDKQAIELDELKKGMAKQQLEKQFCSGLSDQELDAETPAMLRAALLGDPDSAACYLQSTSHGISGALDHPEWMADYKQYAPQVLQAAIEQGSWTVLDNVAFVEQRVSSNLLGEALGYDPVQMYRLKKLRDLDMANRGFPAYGAADLDALGARLDPVAKSGADEWAKDMYQRYYAGRPPPDPSKPSSACSNYGVVD